MIYLIQIPWYFHKNAVPAMSQNLGLGYIASFLELYGYKVKIIDAYGEGFNIEHFENIEGQIMKRIGLSFQDIVNRIDHDVQFIGVSVPFTMYADIAKKLILQIKDKFPKIPLVMGGVFPSTLPEFAMENTNADFVIVGEGELAMYKLIKGENPEDIKGVAFRKEGKIIATGKAEGISNLDSIPFPARHLLPFEKYIQHSQRGNTMDRTASIITSRGCPYDCDFCSVHNVVDYKWRFRSVENIMSEIDELVTKYQVNSIEFEDDNITLDRKRSEELFDKIIEYNQKYPEKRIIWNCHNGIRVDTLNQSLMLKMKESGCQTIGLGVECGDEYVLKSMKKKLDLNKVLEIAKIGQKIGIRMSAFMIIGHPGETHERFLNSLNFFLKLKKSGVSFFAIHIIKTYPGTELYQYCIEKGYLSSKHPISLKNVVEGLSNSEKNCVDIITEDFTAEEIIQRKNIAYRKLMPVDHYLEKIKPVVKLLKKVVPQKIKSRVHVFLQEYV